MRRVLILAILFGAVTAGAAHGQHAVGVSAEIVDAVRVEPLDVRLQATGDGLGVLPSPKRGRSSLLEQVRVTEQEPRSAKEAPAAPAAAQEQRARPASAVTVTRVIAVNS